jgi:hypothetical protein
MQIGARRHPSVIGQWFVSGGRWKPEGARVIPGTVQDDTSAGAPIGIMPCG